jgi:cell division septation protein DedD
VPDIWMPPQADIAAEPITAPLEPVSTGAARAKIAAALAGVLAAFALAAWFAYRTPPTHPAPRSTAAAAQTSAATPALQPAAAPAPEPPTPIAPVAPVAPDSRPTAAAPSFEIVVASFRTESRAAAVAAQVSGAGLAVRRRVIGGWQQVIAGPFASREEADAARQRLEQAGLPGTQVVSATP